MRPAILNPGSLPCRRRRRSTRPLITACAGALRPCSRTSKPPGLTWEKTKSRAHTRVFNLEDSQITRTDRLDRLVLVLALALHWAVSTGMWDAVANRTPAEKRLRGRIARMLHAA